jgi:hypothetical protein
MEELELEDQLLQVAELAIRLAIQRSEKRLTCPKEIKKTLGALEYDDLAYSFLRQLH